MSGRALLIAAACLGGCLGLACASLLAGAEPGVPAKAWEEWRQGTPVQEAPALGIIVQQRLPRTLAAMLAGAGLALAGAVFQALLRNPLATPYTLGIASAGALGAWTAFLLRDAGRIAPAWLGVPTIQVFAFTFALADVAIVWFVAARRRASPAVLLLAGVTLGMLANAGIMLTRYLAAPDRLVAMDRWIMGGVQVLGYAPVLTLVIGVIPCAVYLLLLAPKLDQFGFSTDLAAGRGINVARLQLGAFLAGSLMTALIVSEVGPIGFVGLVVPHAVRAFTGAGHRLLLPCCLAAGAAFLCACDLAARLLLPGETPIGIITTIIGGPFFLYLLMRRKFTNWQ